jgi:hypothetical protein
MRARNHESRGSQPRSTRDARRGAGATSSVAGADRGEHGDGDRRRHQVDRDNDAMKVKPIARASEGKRGELAERAFARSAAAT